MKSQQIKQNLKPTRYVNHTQYELFKNRVQYPQSSLNLMVNHHIIVLVVLRFGEPEIMPKLVWVYTHKWKKPIPASNKTQFISKCESWWKFRFRVKYGSYHFILFHAPNNGFCYDVMVPYWSLWPLSTNCRLRTELREMQKNIQWSWKDGNWHWANLGVTIVFANASYRYNLC